MRRLTRKATSQMPLCMPFLATAETRTTAYSLPINDGVLLHDAALACSTAKGAKDLGNEDIFRTTYLEMVPAGPDSDYVRLLAEVSFDELCPQYRIE